MHNAEYVVNRDALICLLALVVQLNVCDRQAVDKLAPASSRTVNDGITCWADQNASWSTVYMLCRLTLTQFANVNQRQIKKTCLTVWMHAGPLRSNCFLNSCRRVFFRLIPQNAGEVAWLCFPLRLTLRTCDLSTRSVNPLVFEKSCGYKFLWQPNAYSSLVSPWVVYPGLKQTSSAAQLYRHLLQLSSSSIQWDVDLSVILIDHAVLEFKPNRGLHVT